MEIDSTTKQIIRGFQKNEITESIIYKKLAQTIKNQNNREVLEKISGDEMAHYDFWKGYTNEDIKPGKLKIYYFFWLARILGLTFSIKLMERGEANAQVKYDKLKKTIPEVDKIIADEDAHENALIGLIEEEKLNYVGSIVLGLNDALVELTGALAGLTFALQDTKVIAFAGLITGIAASFSMAASEYLSKKSEEQSNALRSSIYTGTAYVITVALLILPYLLISHFMVCLAATLVIAILIILGFNYYIAIAKDLPFKKRFIEMALISLGVSAITFGIGVVIRQFIGVDI